MYITKTDLQNQGITGTDTYLDSLIARVEAILVSIICDNVQIPVTTVTEKFENIFDSYEINLKYSNPVTLTSVNGESAASGDFVFEQQKLKLKNPISSSVDFPYYLTVVYTAGYATTPEDIKQFLFALSSYIHNSLKSEGIQSFRQDLLSVDYGSGKDFKNYLESLKRSGLLSKYINYYAYTL